MAKSGLNMLALSHPCDRDIPFIDIHGYTNAMEPRMAKSGLNIKKGEHSSPFPYYFMVIAKHYYHK